MRALSFLLLAALAMVGCAKPKQGGRELDHDLIRVTKDARLRTDTVGDGKHTDLSTFVLVEAENTSKEGAYVTLGGELADGTGAVVAELRAQSLYIPAGELRTFALVDRERKPRPTANAARIILRGARTGLPPPPARIDGFRQIPDGNKMVVQGTLMNEAARPGNIMVIATFYGEDGRPMTRPFSVLWVDKNGSLPVQFVGPPGSTRGTLFIGDVSY